jgi:hypothetical protein
MDYSVLLLKTVPDCDSLIAIVNTKKADLEFKKYQLEKKRTTTTTTSADRDTEIPSTQAEIAAYQNTLLTLVDVEARKGIQSKLTRAEYKLFTLTERRESYGVLAMLELEFDVNCVANDLVEVDAFLLALNTRKAEL